MSPILPIKALQDNYIWMFYDKPARSAWVVDPGEAMPVIHQLQTRDLRLNGILLTHHHHDHSGGIKELLDYAGEIPIYGSQMSPVTAINHRLAHEDVIQCGDFNFRVIAIPGHTLDHVAYYADPVLFCGDTLFSAGCGKVFEGTAAQMYASLTKLMQLPDTTAIYCGHEYTLNNLRFAQSVEPHNPWIQKKITQVRVITEARGCTLPSLLAEEKCFNPFLRCEQADVRQAVMNYIGKSICDAIDVFAALRMWKNSL